MSNYQHEQNELTQKNFKRIAFINWSLTPILLFFFAWPFYRLGLMANSNLFFNYLASLTFAFGFTLTILHGHVSIAIGSLHRHVYYKWLVKNPFTFGILFREFMTTTRFRISLIIVSILVQIAGIVR
jgi:hypothetical protein